MSPSGFRARLAPKIPGVFSKIVRRTHMYLALFLAPWMMGYAVSTIAMNHRMPRPTAFVTERDQHRPECF